jgi:hypothetical protein
MAPQGCPVVTVAFVAWAGLANVALALSLSGPSSASASSTVDQAALQACIAQRTVNCEQTVPGLSRCMAQRAICNEAAYAELRAQSGPLQPIRTGTDFMTREEAVQRSLLVSPAATASSPVFAESMTLGEVAKRMHLDPAEFGPIDLNRMMWLVTVHAPVMTMGSPRRPPSLVAAFTVVYDAASHIGILTCYGCATLG